MKRLDGLVDMHNDRVDLSIWICTVEPIKLHPSSTLLIAPSAETALCSDPGKPLSGLSIVYLSGRTEFDYNVDSPQYLSYLGIPL